jgi:hypothetical protein
MNPLKFKKTAASLAVGVFVLSVIVCTEIRAKTPTLDPAATKILKHLTDYIVSLKKFSLHTENTLEDLLESGSRIDFNISANVIVSRPN